MSEKMPSPEDIAKAESMMTPEQKESSEKREMNFEVIEEELEYVEDVLKSISEGDENVAYADTGDAMESIDMILGSHPDYQKSLEIRREASKKIMQGSEDEKKEGMEQIEKWVEEVKNIIKKGEVQS